MNNSKTPNRLHMAMLAVLIGGVALVGCKKKEEPVQMPPAASETAPMPQASAAMATGYIAIRIDDEHYIPIEAYFGCSRHKFRFMATSRQNYP